MIVLQTFSQRLYRKQVNMAAAFENGPLQRRFVSLVKRPSIGSVSE